MKNFKDTGLNSDLLKAVEELGFETPTPIQVKTIPHLLSSTQDLIALAQTGTGKTAAFGLPSLQMTDVNDKSPQTIVLCPTRELCLQIAKDFSTYSKYTKGIGVVAVYGGASIDTQIRALNKGAQIIVGTPGRTNDLIRRRRLKLGNIKRVILDEADEMLTMGFKEELDSILKETPREKQTLLFSATMSREVRSISKKYMVDPEEMAVAKVNIGAANVKHLYYMVNARDRYEVLKRIADMNPTIYGIVFCRTRRETKEVANKLMHDGYSADALHGDLSQAQRDEVMGRFRKKHLQILVATDVAARGLDVNDLTHVINFNLPDDSEIYTHRSGRTGRAGKSGIAIAIIHTRETRKLRDIEKTSGIKFTKELVPDGKDICTTQLYKLIDKIEKVKVDNKQIEPFLPEIYKKLEWLSREDLIKHFVSAEFNRFLDYYKNAKDINVNESKRGNDRNDRGSRRERGDRRSSESFTRYYFNVGTANGLNPARLIGLINEGLKSDKAEIGKIEVLKKFSFAEVEKTMDNVLIDGLKGKKFEDVPLLVEVSENKPASGDRGGNRGGDRSSRSGGYSGKRNSGGSNFRKKNSNHRKGGGGGRNKKKQW